MPYFEDGDEVYRYIGGLLAGVVGDDELGPKLQRAGTIVRFHYQNPEAVITFKLLAGEEVQVDLGDSELDPEIVMTADADVAHLFWLGRVNVTVALARGQMKATGPVAKILKLVPLIKPVFPRYRELLEREGRTDLLEV
ncbi:MAG TPA: SCP2 sterol-binding domain-containing protein [Thermoleophilaceae bacterium]|nr:SCP2 sterol-binding domain-containing protein [Thermoleophilaceae bacterium]